MKIWSSFILCKHCSFPPHSFVPFLFPPFCSCFSTLSFWDLFWSGTEEQWSRRRTLSQVLQAAVQSCLCGRAILADSESGNFISHAQGHELADFSPLLSSPLLSSPTLIMFPRCLSPFSRVACTRQVLLHPVLDFTEYIYQTCRAVCFLILRCWFRSCCDTPGFVLGDKVEISYL